MLKKLYSKVMGKTNYSSIEDTMYYDPELAMIRSIKKDREPVSYCASPIFLNESIITKSLSGNKTDKKAANVDLIPA
jgi:hypothetical protein